MKFKPLSLAIALCFSAILYANPEGASVQSGSVSINTPATGQMVINQATDKAIINWQSFSIGNGEKVQFVVPNSGSATLNRVVGNDPSQIFGQLSSNGILYLINPNGIVFGANSQVNTAALIASTLNISDHDFLNNRNNFEMLAGAPMAKITNLGSLTSEKGVIALLAPQIDNQGIIDANLGQIALGAGTKVVLNFSGNQLVGFTVEGTPQLFDENGQAVAAINQSGILAANRVFLTAHGVQDVLSKAINMSGYIKANSAAEQNGEIILSADDGNIDISGTMQANGANGGGKVSIMAENINLAPSTQIEANATENGNGGTVYIMGQNHTTAGGVISARGAGTGSGGNVETSGKQTLNFDNVTVDTSGPGGIGTWLLDPEDIYLGATQMNLIAQALQNNNIIIATNNSVSGNGDITIGSNLTWSSNTYLQLSAYRDINFNSGVTISNTGSGGLVLRADNTATGTGTVNFNGSAPQVLMASGGSTEIFYNPTGGYSGSEQSLVGADRYAADVSGGTLNSYMLVNSASALQSLATGAPLNGKYALGQNINLSSISNFAAIGSGAAFTGYFNGNYYTLSNLTMTRNANNTGLFSQLGAGSQVINLALTNVNVSGTGNVGSLVGNAVGATIQNVSVTGTITGSTNNIGGIAGSATTNSVLNYVESDVTATATLSGVGGIVGNLTTGTTLNNAKANAILSGVDNVGGLVGTGGNGAGLISNSYSSGSFTSSRDVGGIVGQYASGAGISNSYSTANLKSTDINTNGAGGLIGTLSNSITITNSFFNGSFTGNQEANTGGLIGLYNGGTAFNFNNAYWLNTLVANPIGAFSGGGSYGTGATALTSTQFSNQSNFPTFTFGNNPWAMGSSNPILPNAGTYPDRSYVTISLAAPTTTPPSTSPNTNPAVVADDLEDSFKLPPQDKAADELLENDFNVGDNACIDVIENENIVQIVKRNPCHQNKTDIT